MNIGKRHNADPRWLLPLLCRRGHITRNEIGAIRIGPAETHFQVPTAIAAKFAAAVQRTAGSADDEEAILIEQSDEAPRHVARENRKNGRSGNDSGQRPGPKPHRKGSGGKQTYSATPYAGKKKKPGGNHHRRDG